LSRFDSPRIMAAGPGGFLLVGPQGPRPRSAVQGADDDLVAFGGEDLDLVADFEDLFADRAPAIAVELNIADPGFVGDRLGHRRDLSDHAFDASPGRRLRAHPGPDE